MPVDVDGRPVITGRELAEMILALPEDQQNLPVFRDSDGIAYRLNPAPEYPCIRVRYLAEGYADTEPPGMPILYIS